MFWGYYLSNLLGMVFKSIGLVSFFVSFFFVFMVFKELLRVEGFDFWRKFKKYFIGKYRYFFYYVFVCVFLNSLYFIKL